MMRQQHYLCLYAILDINLFYFFHLSLQYSFRGCVRQGRCQPQQYVTCKTYLTSASLDTWHLTKNGLTRSQSQMDERNNRGNAKLSPDVFLATLKGIFTFLKVFYFDKLTNLFNSFPSFHQ